MNKDMRYVSWLFATAALCPLSAHAQSPATPSVDVSEVVVTAQRRDERLIDVPISISTASKQQLVDMGVSNTRELTNFAPGLNAATQGFALQPSIRGIGTTSTALGDETNVSIYIDNVYIPFQTGNSFGLKNVERIEVLKGPQGTLFGRNATGGAIRIVTADPSHEPLVDVSADYGFELRSRELNAYASTGLSDTVAVGLSAYLYKDDGFVDNIVAGQDSAATTEEVTVRGKLLWRPNDKFKVVAALDYTNLMTSAGFSTTIRDGVNAFKNVAGVILPPAPSQDPYTVALNFDPLVKTVSNGGYVNAEFQAAGHTFTSITAYREFSLKSFLDSDRTGLDLSRFLIFQDVKVFTQEATVASNHDGALNYVGGVYFYDSEAVAPGNLNFSAPLGPVTGGVRPVTGPLVRTASVGGRVDTSSWAAFGEATWQVADRLTLIGGYRYTHEKKEALAINNLTGVSIPDEKSWDNSSIRATAKYEFAPDTNVYLTYSTGFKSGAFNASAVTNPLQVVEPEKVDAFEVGAKARVSGITIMAAAYRYNYDNIQLQVNNILNPAAGTTILLNAATAKIRGAEVQIGGPIGDNFTFQAGLSWIPTAKYTTFLGGVTFIPNAGGLGARSVPTDLSGTRMIRTPELTFNLSATYTQELAGGRLKIASGFFWSDDFIWIPGGAVDQKSYATLNSRISWTTPDERYTVSVWGRNLTNEQYWLQSGANTGGFSGSYAQPREVGVGLQARF